MVLLQVVQYSANNFQPRNSSKPYWGYWATQFVFCSHFVFNKITEDEIVVAAQSYYQIINTECNPTTLDLANTITIYPPNMYTRINVY